MSFCLEAETLHQIGCRDVAVVGRTRVLDVPVADHGISETDITTK